MDLNKLSSISKDVLSHCDIVEIVSMYRKLEKKGKNYTALCPFHDDKNIGNFYVSQDKQIFKCFACNESGNAITFIKKIENCSYVEAIKKVAELSNYTIEEIDQFIPKKNIKPEVLEMFNCLENINNFYKSALFNSEVGRKNALTYLSNRGINEEIIKTFDIGFSLNDGKNSMNFLLSKSFSSNIIEKCGIGKIRDKEVIDINAGRITFGLRDRDNKIVGFSARRIVNDESSKYINTKGTEVFNKSELLYNYVNASKESKKENYVFVVEGFMDVIALYRIGIKSAVALMGTSLTNDHIKLLRNLNVEVRLCLDLDEPGQSNSLEHIYKLTSENINFSMVSNDVSFKEKDCDEILNQHNDETLKKYINTTISPGEWILNYYKKFFNLNNLNDKKQLIAKIAPFILSIKNSFDFDEYINKISEITGFDKNIIVNFYRKIKLKQNENKNFNDKNRSKNLKTRKINTIELVERQIIYYMLTNRSAIDMYNKYIGFLSNNEYRNIASMLIDYSSVNKEEIKLNQLCNYLEMNNITLKDKYLNLCDEIISNEDYKFPEFSEENFKVLINTINILKEKDRIDKNANIKSEKTYTNIDEAKRLQYKIEERKRLLKGASND